MKYELETFHQIVSGDLDPARQPPGATNQQLAYIRQHGHPLVIRYLAWFEDNENGTHRLANCRQFGALSSEAERIICPLQAENAPGRLSELSGQFIGDLGIGPHTIIEAELFTAGSRHLLSLLTARELDSLSADEIRYWYHDQLLFEETERFKRSFHDYVFSLESEEKIRLFVQNHQGQLETFTDMILEIIPPEERKHIHRISSACSLTDVHKLIYQYLEVGLAHIERHFMKYLDLTTQAPYRSKVIFSESLSEKVDFIHIRIKGGSLSQALAKILSKPLSKLADIQEEEEFTYHELFYYQRFLLEFYRILSQEELEVTDEVLVETLYQANYNSVDFVKFLTDQVHCEVDQQEEVTDKLEVLYRQLKEYNLRRCKVSVPCYGSRSIQKHMVAWLDEEIEYLTKVMEAKIKRNAARTFTKIETPLSVNAVIYLLRLQKKVGMISNQHHAEVMRCMAENVSTKRQKYIALHSVERKYYNVEDSIKKKLRGYLQQIIDLIDQSLKPGG